MAGKKTDKAKKRVNFNAQSSDSEDEPSNIVLRSKIDKKLLNNSNKIQMNFSDSDSSDDDKSSTKKSNIITINPARQQRLDQKAKSTAFSKENQRMLKQLQEQVELEEKEDRRKARLARKHAKRKEAEKNGSKYESSEEEVSTEDDYSSEDDDGSLITADMDAKIYETLLSLKTKDPRIYDKDVVYFKKPVEGEEVETTTPRTKADKKLTLGKYLTQQAAKGEDIVSDSDEDEPDFETFQQEQDRIKSDFFKTLHEDEAKKNKAANDVSSDDSDDDDFFGASKKVWNPLDESDSDEEEAQKVKEATEFANSIDDSSKISDASFLSNYLEQGWWKEKDASKIPAAEALLGKTRSETLAATFDIENADNEEEANDQFEAEYNFRFMEEGADEVAAHPRSHMIDDSVRKKDTTRRDARLRKVERQNLEKAQRLEEIKRLKNVKRQLLKDRMNTIYTVAGLEKSEEMIDDDIEYDMQEEYADNSKKPSKDDKKNRLSAKDITDDFDPEEYDKMMEKMFGDDFYGDIDENNLEHEELLLDNKNAQAIIDEAINAVDDREDDEEDESVPAGLEIPADFDTDDSDLDDYEREDRRKSRNKFIMQHKVVTKSTNKSRFKEAGSIKRTVQDVLDTGNKREMEIWWKQHKKEILSKGDAHEKMRDMTRDEKEEAVKKYIQEEMNKIDELDKEDVLSGTRYKYRQVEAHDYGMDVLELFNTDDRELNRRVNLRRLAAYRKDEDRGRTWKDIQDDQRQVYKEYVKKTGKSRPYDKHGQKDISSKEKEAVESFDNRHKRWNLGMDLSQAHNRKGPKGVKSTDWYSSKNNFTIPSKLVNKRITFDGKSDVLEAFKKHKSK